MTLPLTPVAKTYATIDAPPHAYDGSRPNDYTNRHIDTRQAALREQQLAQQQADHANFLKNWP